MRRSPSLNLDCGAHWTRKPFAGCNSRYSAQYGPGAARSNKLHRVDGNAFFCPEKACDGGNTALMLAHKDPARFPRLAAISPNYLVSGTTDGTLREIRRIYRLMSLLKRAGLPVQKHLLRFDLMLRDMGISEAALQGIRTDLLILYAEHDMIKEDHLQRLAGLVPGARLQKIMGCTHMTIYRHPEAIQAMGDYLG